MHPRGDADCCKAGRDRTDNQGICCDHCTIANGYGADDARMAPNEDMIAYCGSACLRSGTNGAHVVKCTVSSDFGSTMHPDRTTMRDDEAWTNLGIRVNVDECHDYKQLS
jgi:hypothetical protein